MIVFEEKGNAREHPLLRHVPSWDRLLLDLSKRFGLDPRSELELTRAVDGEGAASVSRLCANAGVHRSTLRRQRQRRPPMKISRPKEHRTCDYCESEMFTTSQSSLPTWMLSTTAVKVQVTC